MKYKKLLFKLQKKILNILEHNEKNYIFNNINILIFNTILKNLYFIEKNIDNQKHILNVIDYYLNNQHELTNDITIYSNKNSLTKISENIILNIYVNNGFQQCFNDCFIREHCLENNIDYNLFFNQADSNEEIKIDYFSLNKINKNCFFILDKIDDLEIRIYDI